MNLAGRRERAKRNATCGKQHRLHHAINWSLIWICLFHRSPPPAHQEIRARLTRMNRPAVLPIERKNSGQCNARNTAAESAQFTAILKLQLETILICSGSKLCDGHESLRTFAVDA
jgi:hypothetical protein